jgi:predicted Holliday junction resolvase-like endonuclease
MELTSFVLGIVTIVAIIFMIAVVVGLVKILKLNEQVQELQTQINNNQEAVYRNMQSAHAETWQQFEATGRDITMVERTLQNQINEEIKVIQRYTDSRIDKLIDTYFNVKNAEQQTKKLIKG